MISFAIALAAQAITIPPTFAIYCLASSGVAQPVRNTDYARMTAAFRSEFSFNATVSMTSGTTGLLVFRGGRGNAETISYTVKPYRTDDGQEGLSLQSMRVRLAGVSESLVGDDMCWRTFSIINKL